MKTTLLAAALAAACLLSACGGGGDDVDGNADDACPAQVPASAGMQTIPAKPCGESRL